MKSTRSSVLLMTLFVIAGLAFAIYSVYDLTLTAYRISQRNDALARAKVVADGELEHIYYLLESQMMTGLPASQVPGTLATLMNNQVETPPASFDPTTSPPWVPTGAFYDPFVVMFQETSTGDPTNEFPKDHWKVRRSVAYEPYSNAVAGGSTYNYFTVKVEVKSGTGAPFAVDYRIGRHMSNSITSIFQYNIFAQGDLEFSPDGATTINGDIAANGSIIMGSDASSGAAASLLRINAAVYYVQGATTQFSGTVPNSDPPIAITPPVWGTSQTAQLQTMPAALNLLGGLNAAQIAVNYAEGTHPTNLFGSITFVTDPQNPSNSIPDPTQLATATNLVYRSIIAPPPSAVATAAATTNASSGDLANPNGYQSEYPGAASLSDLSNMVDDPGIAALRAYNRAGLIITVNGDGSYTVAAPGGAAPITNFTTTGGAGGSPVLTTSLPSSPNMMYDLREGKNVTLVDINVGNLAQAIAANSSIFPPGQTFNGVLYVYLANSSQATPAAIRLDNGTATPGSGLPTPPGFTVATNGGIYVRGDYNTVTNNGVLVADPATGVLNDGTNGTPTAGTVNPAALMGDQITILSQGWNDKVVTPELSGIAPPATNPTDPNAQYNLMHNAAFTSGDDPVDYTVTQQIDPKSNKFISTDVTYTYTDPVSNHPVTVDAGVPRVVPGGTHATIAAGLLTGNTIQEGGSSVYSGGGANLVRFLEDWNQNGNGDSINFYGSFGQLFQSTVFTGQWDNPFSSGDYAGYAQSAYVYNYPGYRVYSYNGTLKSKPPPCSPNTTAYSRGTVFTW